MEKKISSFLMEQKCLTFCTAVNSVPHCANCYYAYIEELHSVVFKSDRATQHIKNALLNQMVAGTIVPDIHQVTALKGIQFTGIFFAPVGEISETLKLNYYKRFPFALVMPGDLWAIELTDIKMTDNTLGFGKKLVWAKPTTEKNYSQMKKTVS